LKKNFNKKKTLPGPNLRTVVYGKRREGRAVGWGEGEKEKGDRLDLPSKNPPSED